MLSFCACIRPSVRPSVYDHIHILKVCKQDILQTACANFIKFTIYVQISINWLHFEVKRSKVKVTTRSSMVKNHLFKMHKSFRRRHTGRRFVVEDRLLYYIFLITIYDSYDTTQCVKSKIFSNNCVHFWNPMTAATLFSSYFYKQFNLKCTRVAYIIDPRARPFFDWNPGSFLL